MNTAIYNDSGEMPVANYTVAASADENGTISPNGEITVKYGESQTYTMIANAGYQIENVQIDGTSIGAVSALCIERGKCSGLWNPACTWTAGI